LFDAVSAVIGLCDRNTFEGEAAMALESLVTEVTDREYPVDLRVDTTIVVDFSQTVIGIINDMLNGVKKELISGKFHNTLSSVILRTVAKISETLGLRDVALSGGTFQNLYLLKRTTELLKSRGMNVFVNEAVPCNDACISLGQAYLVRERLKRGQGR
jgi:hydrogenase maturation protein HypF